jgi:transposase-like protein
MRRTSQTTLAIPCINPETLRNWVEKAEIDSGQRPGSTSDDKKRIAELERENRELRRANEILKAASAYFARELDPVVLPKLGHWCDLDDE